jgi:hypothetical protein
MADYGDEDPRTFDDLKDSFTSEVNGNDFEAREGSKKLHAQGEVHRALTDLQGIQATIAYKNPTLLSTASDGYSLQQISVASAESAVIATADWVQTGWVKRTSDPHPIAFAEFVSNGVKVVQHKYLHIEKPVAHLFKIEIVGSRWYCYMDGLVISSCSVLAGGVGFSLGKYATIGGECSPGTNPIGGTVASPLKITGIKIKRNDFWWTVTPIEGICDAGFGRSCGKGTVSDWTV